MKPRNLHLILTEAWELITAFRRLALIYRACGHPEDAKFYRMEARRFLTRLKGRGGK